jgi:hypothetical protein
MIVPCSSGSTVHLFEPAYIQWFYKCSCAQSTTVTLLDLAELEWVITVEAPESIF